MSSNNSNMCKCLENSKPCMPCASCNIRLSAFIPYRRQKNIARLEMENSNQICQIHLNDISREEREIEVLMFHSSNA